MIDIATLQALNAPTREERGEPAEGCSDRIVPGSKSRLYQLPHPHHVFLLSLLPCRRCFCSKSRRVVHCWYRRSRHNCRCRGVYRSRKIADMPVTVGMEARVSMVCTAGSPTPRQKRFRLAANGSAIATAWFLKVRSVKAWRLASGLFCAEK